MVGDKAPNIQLINDFLSIDKVIFLSTELVKEDSYGLVNPIHYSLKAS